MCLGNISKDVTVDMKRLGSVDEKIGFYGYVYDFSVDYGNTNISNVTLFYKWLDSLSKRLFFWSKKHGSVKNM